MKFGLFGGAKSSGAGPSGDSQTYNAFIDYVLYAEELGYESLFVVEHHFTGNSQVSASLNLLSFLAGRTLAHAARYRRRGAALAQSGAAGRAGGDARPSLQRPFRFRRRQGLSRFRVRELLHPEGGSDRALRGVHRDHATRLDQRGALHPPGQALDLPRHRRRAAAVAAPASAVLDGRRQLRGHRARRAATATISCSTRSPRSS